METDGDVGRVLRLERVSSKLSLADIKSILCDAGIDKVYVDYMRGMTHGHLLFKQPIHIHKIVKKFKSEKRLKLVGVGDEEEALYISKNKNSFLKRGVVLLLSGFPAGCRESEIVTLLQQQEIDFASLTYTDGDTQAHVRLRQEDSAQCAHDRLAASSIRVRDFPIEVSLLSPEDETNFLKDSLRNAKRKKKRRYVEKCKLSYSGCGTVLRLSGFPSNTDTRDIMKKLQVFDNMSKEVKLRYLPGDKDAHLHCPNTQQCQQLYEEVSEVGGMLEVNSAEITLHYLTPEQEKSHINTQQVVSSMQYGGCVVRMEGFNPSTTRAHITHTLHTLTTHNYSLHYSPGKIKAFLIVKEPTTAQQFVESIGSLSVEVNGKQVQLITVTSPDEEKEFLLRAKTDREAADSKRRRKQL